MKKTPLNPSAQDLKIQWEIQFSTFFVVGQNAPNFFLELKYGPSHFKTAFKINLKKNSERFDQ